MSNLKDPKLQTGIDALVQAMAAHTNSINAIRPPDPDKKLGYETLLKAFGEDRGAPLFYPYIGSGMGNGPWVELLDGSVKYDMITGVGVHFFGHSSPLLMRASLEAALQNTALQGNLQQNRENLELMELFKEISGLKHVFLTTSGVMANENALKLAFHHKPQATRVLAFDRCFAGRTLALSQVTDKPSFREGLPLNLSVDYIPFFNPENPEESTRIATRALLSHIERYPGRHAIMIFELVQGEGGIYPGSTSFFTPLMDICKAHHIAVFADEVQTFGRTSRFFAYQHFELESYVDIAAVGKLSQVCATLFTEKYKPKPGLLSQTFSASTACVANSLAILKALKEGAYFGEKGRIASLFKRFESYFLKWEKKYPGVLQGPYGVGGMIGFTPLDGSYEIAARLLHRLFDAGVIAYLAGSHPTRIRMLPPMAILTTAHVDEVMTIMEKACFE